MSTVWPASCGAIRSCQCHSSTMTCTTWAGLPRWPSTCLPRRRCRPSGLDRRGVARRVVVDLPVGRWRHPGLELVLDGLLVLNGLLVLDGLLVLNGLLVLERLLGRGLLHGRLLPHRERLVRDREVIPAGHLDTLLDSQGRRLAVR